MKEQEKAKIVQLDPDGMNGTVQHLLMDSNINQMPYADAAPEEPAGVDFGIDGRSVRVSQEAYSIFLAREAAAREKIAALQQRLNAADQLIDELTAHRLVEPAIYQKPIDYWEGYGYVDRSCHIELRKMVSHLENLLDAIPEGPLYRRPPEQFEPFPGYPPVPDDRKLNPAEPQ